MVTSRHWLHDSLAIKALLEAEQFTTPLYLGLTDSHVRVNSLLADALGDRPRPHIVNAPAGLDPGAQTLAEIAATVVSPIL